MAKGSGLRGIQKDIEKKFYKAVAELAEDVAFDIEAAYEQSIDEFYADYDPK